MPFSPQGFPTRLEGKDAVYRQYSSLPKNYTSMKFPNLVIYPMLDPNLVLAEYRGEIQIAATGKQYNNRYIRLFRLRDAPGTGRMPVPQFINQFWDSVLVQEQQQKWLVFLSSF